MKILTPTSSTGCGPVTGNRHSGRQEGRFAGNQRSGLARLGTAARKDSDLSRSMDDDALFSRALGGGKIESWSVHCAPEKSDCRGHRVASAGLDRIASGGLPRCHCLPSVPMRVSTTSIQPAAPTRRAERTAAGRRFRPAKILSHYCPNKWAVVKTLKLLCPFVLI